MYISSTQIEVSIPQHHPVGTSLFMYNFSLSLLCLSYTLKSCAKIYVEEKNLSETNTI